VDRRRHEQPERERQGRIEHASAARRTDAWEELEGCVEDVKLEEVDQKGTEGGFEECGSVKRTAVDWNGCIATEVEAEATGGMY
jgi:hypothetical protein